MSFWSDLFSALVDGVSDNSSSARPSKRESTPNHRKHGHSPGDVLSGEVEFVAEKFAKVVSGGLTAVVFPAEMADGFVSDPTNVLSAGQRTEFVLLKNDARGWKASIRATPEARAREALTKLQDGDLVEGRVLELKDRGIVVDVAQFEAWIPITELAWRWIDHPSEVVAIGDQVEAKIIRIEAPEGWLDDRRQRRAKAVASLRACIAKPVSPAIPIAFSGMPFKVWAVAKTPRSCDAVTLFVLEEIVTGHDRESITAITGLDPATLENVHSVLGDLSLAKNWLPTDKGKGLVEAIVLSRNLNDDPIRGLFVSAAHPTTQLISAHEHRQQDSYPRDWPRPPFDKSVEDVFAKATDEALPEPLLEKLVPDDKRRVLARLQEDNRLRVFIRRDGARPWKPVFVETPEDWFLAGLWWAFKPVFGKPYRPANGKDQCKNFVMIRCQLVYANQTDSPPKIVFFEPYTRTLWCLNHDSRVRLKKFRGDGFPPLPTPEPESVESDSGEPAWELKVDSWCSLKVL